MQDALRPRINTASALIGVACVVAGYIAAPAPAGQPAAAEAETTVPPVLLTDHHRKLCTVGVGGAFPNLRLPSLASGEVSEVLKNRGARATVIVLFGERTAHTLTMLRDVGHVAERIGQHGVAFAAIAVGRTADEANALVAETRFAPPTFVDPSGEGFAAVGAELLPRVYVVDPKGVIVWFDIEYSQATERELRTALGVLTR